MRIRNKRNFDFWFPYAGQDKKGYKVKANKVSPTLPSDRFYDPLLQNDWKKDKIEVLLSDADIVVLGPEVAACVTGVTVQVDKDKVVQVQEAPQATPAPTVQPSEKPAENIAPPPAAIVEPIVPHVVKTPVQLVPPPSQEPPVPDPIVQTPVLQPPIAPIQDAPPAPIVQTPVAPIQDAPPVPVPAAIQAPPVEPPKPIDDDIHCAECDKHGDGAYVKVDENVGIPMCRYCRAKASKIRNAVPTQDGAARVPAPAPVAPMTAAPPPAAAPMPTEPPAPATLTPAPAPVDPPHVPGIPHTPAPAGAPTLSDLQDNNRRVAAGQPDFNPGAAPGGIPTLHVPDPTGLAVPVAPAPAPVAPAANVANITHFMGDMDGKTGTPAKV